MIAVRFQFRHSVYYLLVIALLHHFATISTALMPTMPNELFK